MSQLGWESRKANRQQEEEQILHAAMKLFRQHLPEMLEESPDASQFESKWSTIDLVLQQSLKSEKAYRRAHSFICTQLEAGNRHGIFYHPAAKSTRTHTEVATVLPNDGKHGAELVSQSRKYRDRT
jgi:hypothetical protein